MKDHIVARQQLVLEDQRLKEVTLMSGENNPGVVLQGGESPGHSGFTAGKLPSS